MSKKAKPFRSPFAGVKLPEKPAHKPAPKAKPAPGVALASTRDARVSEDELWAMATDGADPLLDRSQRLRPKADPIAHAPAPLDAELAAYDELRDLVGGDVPFVLSHGDSFLEGSARGVDAHLLKKLRRGEFGVQGRLDLHGLVREVALRALESFVVSARAEDKRCVLVVHGRGLHSPGQVPVLKDAVRQWLSTERLGRQVVAFCSARPQDGGAGAVYLLLRRR